MSDPQASCLERNSGKLNDVLASGFGGLGRRVARMPCLTVAITLAVSFLLASAFANFQQNSLPQEAFVPEGTEALDDRADITANFGANPRVNSFFFTAPDQQSNVVTTAILVEVFDFVELVQTVEAKYRDANGVDVDPTFQDLCVRVPVPNTNLTQCLITNPLFAAWGFNRAALLADPTPLVTLNAAFTLDQLEQFFGGVQSSGGQMTSAVVLTFQFFLEDNSVDPDPNDGTNELRDLVAEAWEGKMIDLALAAEGESGGVFRVTLFNIVAISEEIGGAIAGDVPLQTASYVIIIAFVTVVLQRRCDRVHSSFALSLLAVATIGLSIMSGFGMAQYTGSEFGNTHGVLPFIVLGIGADASFIVVNSFRRTSLQDSLPDRAGKALEHAGVSLTVSSLTNVAAFAVGSTTAIPDLSSFCVYAALTFFFVWVYMSTFFVAAIVLNERRENGGKLDVLCCFSDCREEGSVKGVQEFKPSRLSRWMEATYAPFIMQNWFRAAVMVAWVGLFSYAGYNISLLTVEATTENFIPDDSYLKDAFVLTARYFGGDDTDVSVVTEEFDYFAKRGELFDLGDAFRFSNFETEPPFIDPSFTFWMEEFVDQIEADNSTAYTIVPAEITASDPALGGRSFPSTSANFYKYLRLWLDDPTEAGAGALVANFVFTDAARTQLKRTRVDMEHIPIGAFQDNGQFKEDPAKVVEAMDKMYEITDGLGFPAYPYSFKYTEDWATYKIIASELVRNVSLALMAVFIVTFVLIGNPFASSLVFVATVSSIIELLGVQVLVGLSIDTVAVVLFVLAVGLSVDYSVHVAYGFMTVDGSRKERVAKTLGDVGVPVVNGAISTFLAIMLQSASKSYVFRTVFLDFTFAVLFGALNGLVLLPVMLSLVGPKKPYIRNMDRPETLKI